MPKTEYETFLEALRRQGHMEVSEAIASSPTAEDYHKKVIVLDGVLNERADLTFNDETGAFEDMHVHTGPDPLPGKAPMTAGQFCAAVAKLQVDNELKDDQVCSGLIGIVVALCTKNNEDPVAFMKWAVGISATGETAALLAKLAKE